MRISDWSSDVCSSDLSCKDHSLSSDSLPGVAAGQAGEQTFIQFDDNSLLPMLYGEHDQHLLRIEQQLGVSLASRGNRLAISGPPASVEAAKDRKSTRLNSSH